MPTCVKIVPANSVIGFTDWSGNVKGAEGFIVFDPTCSSGIVIGESSGGGGSSGGTGSVVLTVDSSSDPERVADMASLFYAFLAVLVVVWGVKQLLNLFTGDTEK